MSSSKKKSHPAKHCRIFTWIEKHDPDLADAIRILCMEGALSPGRGVGTTFLYPKDKTTRAEIADKAYSDDAEEAVKMLESLIIPDIFRDAADFDKKTVGSRLGVQILIDKVDGSEVVLKGGGRLSKAADFKLLREDKNIAVWIVDGSVPTDGPEYSTPRRQKRGKTTGGATGHGVSTRRSQIGHEVATDALAQRAGFRGPYLASATSLLNFLRGNHPDAYLTVLPILDLNPFVTFYLLLEPYKQPGTGDYMISDSIISEWNGTALYEDALAEYQSFFDDIPKQTQASATDPSNGSPVVPWVFRDPKKTFEMTDAVRKPIASDARQINKLGPPKKVLAAYENVMTNNAFAGLSPVFPDSTVRAIPAAKKLWQDELRFIIHEATSNLAHAPAFDPNDFVTIIGAVKNDRPGNNYAREISLSNREMLKHHVDAREEVGLLTRFVNSDNFLYAAKPGSIVGGTGGMTYEFGPELFEFYPADAYKKAFLLGTSVPRKPLVDPKALIQVREHFKRYGSLPAGLGSSE